MKPELLQAVPNERLQRQLRFLMQAERLRTVLRGSRISDGSRHENSAEHSWHLTLFALVLSEWASEAVDIGLVVKMLALHDLVEIECGDTPLFGTVSSGEQLAIEKAAALRIFGNLPNDQSVEFLGIWEEFENAATPSAKFAKALDRFQPLLLDHVVGGGTWVDFAVDEARVRKLTEAIHQNAPELAIAAEMIFVDAIANGWIKQSIKE